MSRKIRLLALVLSAFSMLALVACSSDDDGDDTGDATSAATTETSSAGEGGEAAYTLKEFSIDGPSELAAGEVTFEVSNAGALPHEFLVVKTDTPAADLPTNGTGADLTGLETVVQIDQFNPGSDESATVDLAAGHYVLICNIAGHYAGGMHADLTVN